jgi:hypothetical protein
MSKQRIIAAALFSLSGAALAQDNGNSGFAAHHQAMEAFCSSHAQDCADLKQLHETARQTCQNAQSTVGACRSAREAVRAKEQALQAEGFPAPLRGMGRQGAGGPPPAPPAQ